MQRKRLVGANELGSLAKESRERAGLTKAKLARLLGVTRGTIHQAEEYPEMSLTRIRVKIIERCGFLKVSGPLYEVEACVGEK